MTRAKTSLLIVDDDAPIRKLLERVALRAGFDVDMARDGLEALEMMQQKQYAIAIVDLMMPRLSGYDLLQKISTMSPRPIVLVATAMTNSEVSKIDDTLVRRVIRKPFDVKVVAEALIETAKQLTQPSPITSPEAAVIHISAEDLTKQIDDETQQQRQDNDKKPDQPVK